MEFNVNLLYGFCWQIFLLVHFMSCSLLIYKTQGSGTVNNEFKKLFKKRQKIFFVKYTRNVNTTMNHILAKMEIPLTN